VQFLKEIVVKFLGVGHWQNGNYPVFEFQRVGEQLGEGVVSDNLCQAVRTESPNVQGLVLGNHYTVRYGLALARAAQNIQPSGCHLPSLCAK